MKVALTGDLHFGVKDSDKKFQDSQFAFLKNTVNYCRDTGIEDLFILGDLFDTRHTLNVLTLNRVIDFFKNYIPNCLTVWVLLGNHDLYYKNTIDINSLITLRGIKNVKIIDKPTLLDDTLLVPWVTDYEQFRQEVEPIKAKRIFGHFDVIGAKMNNVQVAQNGFQKEELFSCWQYVYSGHYHHHSETVVGDNRLVYIGSPYQLSRAEIEEKGFYVLDTKTEALEFIKNYACIEYRKLRYPDLPEDLKSFVNGHIIDVEVSWEDSKYMNKVNAYLEKIEAAGPAYPVNAIYQRRTERASTEQIDASKITILSLGMRYIEDSDDIKNKSKVFEAFKNLYSRFSPQ